MAAAGLLALLRGLGQRHVGHVGARGLDAGAEADAKQASGRAGLAAPRLKRRVVGQLQQQIEALGVVAGIVKRASRGLVGKIARGDEIPPPDLGRVEPEFSRRYLHGAFQAEVELRAAVAAVEADGRLVGGHQAVFNGDVAHAIAAVGSGVHAIDGSRFRCPHESADVDAVLETKPAEPALGVEGSLDLVGPVGGAG